MIRIELALMLIVAGTVLMSIAALIILLTLGRRHRARRADPPPVQVADAPPSAAPARDPSMPRAIVETMTRAARQPAIPDHLRLPVREAAPDQVIIQIEPPEGPTRDQRNVQRLIAHFKEGRPTPTDGVA